MSSKVNLLALVALLLWLSTAAAGCVVFDAPQYECTSDKDCAGQCSDVGVCVGRGKSMPVRLSWTVAGQEIAAPSAQLACSGVDELEVRFLHPLADKDIKYSVEVVQVRDPRPPPPPLPASALEIDPAALEEE